MQVRAHTDPIPYKDLVGTPITPSLDVDDSATMNSNQPAWSVAVIVPAQNEEATVERCIESIRAAHRAAHTPSALWIVVVADDCSDRTAEKARVALRDEGIVIEAAVRSAGSARRLGAAQALLHFTHLAAQSIWLANTDADTAVRPDWLDVQLKLANQGIAAIAGIVELDTDGPPEARDLYRDTYQRGADGTHPHVHGANMAMRADAYTDAGGWSDAALAEDHCLWGRLRSRGWNMLSSVASVVTTSSRLQGRAPGGFADTLKAGIEARHAHA